MKTFNQSRMLRAGTLSLSAALLMAASTAYAAAPIGHHKPVHHHHIVKSVTPGSQQAEPATPSTQEQFDYHYHPNCFQTSNQVMDGNGGLKWVPKVECRY
jgi:hypothetical protein